MNKFFQWFVDIWNKKSSENNVEIKVVEEEKVEEKEEIKSTEVLK